VKQNEDENKHNCVIEVLNPVFSQLASSSRLKKLES
jgi:hypothetical protein